MSSIADASVVIAAASAAAASQQRKLTPKERGMYHLRRIMTDIQLTSEQEKRLFLLFKQTKQWSSATTDSEILAQYSISKNVLLEQSTIVLLDKNTKFGRNPEMVDVVLNSDSTGNQMVSRLHAEIHAEIDTKDSTKFLKYYIIDKSLNGTYVNNNRVPTLETQKLYLKSGDVIRFGHSNGAAFKPGEFAQVIDSEFSFIFEQALDNVEYMGHTPDGNKIERIGPKAYMHICASGILPHEFDHFSLVPKREPDLSIVPIGMRSNKEQRKMEMIPAHTQLLLNNNQTTTDDNNVLPTNSSAAAIVQIPGLSTQTVIPNMANFDVSLDITRLLREFQQLNGSTNEQINTLLLQQLLQQSQNIQQPNFHYYQQPTSNPLLQQINNINNVMNQQQRVNPLIQPNIDNILAALKQLTTPVLNSHTSFIPEYNTTSINGGGSSQTAAATLATLQAIGNQGGCNSIYQTYSNNDKKIRDDILNAIRMHQELQQSASTPASTTSDHTDELIIQQKKAQAEAEARRNEATLAAVINGLIPTSSVNSLHPEDRDLILNTTNSIKNEEISTSISQTSSKKVVINEMTLKAITEAAEAAAKRTQQQLQQPQPSPSMKSPSIKSPSLKSPTIKSPPIKKEPKSATTIKKQHNSQPGPSTIRDHVQETIDAVAKRVIDGYSEKEDAEEAEAIIREQMRLSSPEVKPSIKPRKNNKKSSIDNSESIEKNNVVLKLLDDAKSKIIKSDPESITPVIKTEQQQEEKQQISQLPGPSKIEQKIEKNIEISTATTSTSSISTVNTTTSTTTSTVNVKVELEQKITSKPSTPKEQEDDREQTSSVDSLIVCEASPNNPALLNASSLNDNSSIFTESKPEILTKSSGVTKSKTLDKIKKRKQTPSSSSESDSEVEEKKKVTKTNKKQNSSERGRKKSTSSVKQRVIRVPRSPIPSKRGPERIPGHKSNEVARLLYDLEGSYMHVARQSDRRRRVGSHEDDSSSDDDQPPAVLNKRKSIDGRTSESPAKKIKDSEDINGHLSSDSDNNALKINGNSNKKRKSDKNDKKKKDKNSRIKLDNDLCSDGSTDDDDEPTTKKKKSNLKINNKIEKKSSKRKSESSKKKRGRKSKNQTFVELTNGEWERCAFSGCKHPRIDGTVNWVQCDDCDRWFHIFCAFGRDDKCVLEDEFHCGCKRVKSTANPNAAAVTA